MKRVPFAERLWQPEPYLGTETRQEREAVVLMLAARREREREDDDPAYRAAVRRKILGQQPLEAVKFTLRLDRAVGDER